MKTFFWRSIKKTVFMRKYSHKKWSKKLFGIF